MRLSIFMTASFTIISLSKEAYSDSHPQKLRSPKEIRIRSIQEPQYVVNFRPTSQRWALYLFVLPA